MTTRRSCRRLAILALVGTVAAAASASAQVTARFDDIDLANLDLETLVNLEFRSAAGLTDIELHQLPVTMSWLDAAEVHGSGARDLNHLLEVYVPNVQFIDHHHLQPHLGFRGIISDREDKYLYQVNGRTMTNRTLLGSDNERALPLLGDIRSISVVRGPASATHGAGALAGVINVETYNGLTFQGADLHVRQGVVDAYSAVEARWGRRLADDSGVFVYYGAARVHGANSEYYFGRSYPAANGLPANVAGRPAAVPKANLGEAGFDELWHKFHASYVRGPLEVWTRFVQDGAQDRPMREIYTSTRPADVPLEEWTRGRQFRNRQFTVFARYKQELAETWNLELVQSYDIWWWRDQRAGVYDLPIRLGREREYLARAVAVWTPDASQSIGFGADYSREWFHNPPYSDTLDRAPVVEDRDWATDRIAFLAEHQWHPGEQWATFISVRTDRHTFTGWLWSPRATLVFSPTERDTIRLMAGQSMRRGGDEELWAEWVRNRTVPEPETLQMYEVTYERELGANWSLAGNIFYEDYDAIGWIPAFYYSSNIGRFGIAGAEVEATYRSERTRVTFSEGFTKLITVKLPPDAPAGGQAITAEPYGFGDDLAEWAPSITKAAMIHDLNAAWSLSASVVYYSGFPGARDYAEYSATFPNPPSAMPVSDPGHVEPYGPNLYVNLGVEFRPSDRWSVRLDAYNLAALVDETLSKRNYYFRLSEFSVQPASLTASVRCRF